jgi:outer membrane biosynthesis protein TonB
LPAPQAVRAPLMASKSMMGPPDPAAPKLIEPKPVEPPAPAKAAVAKPAPAPAPIVVASAPPDEKKASEAAKKTPDATQPALPQIAVKRTEFGVDVGGANSVGGLRALWRGLLKSRSNAPLAALQPIIVIKEGNNGLGMQLRLVAGPLSDAAAAARICAAITERERPCETTVFDGQRLAMTAEDASASVEAGSAKSESSKSDSVKPDSDKPAAAKPVSSRQYYYRHRSYPKRPAPVAEAPPPPKPEPTTLSSFFSRRQQ